MAVEDIDGPRVVRADVEEVAVGFWHIWGSWDQRWDWPLLGRTSALFWWSYPVVNHMFQVCYKGADFSFLEVFVIVNMIYWNVLVVYQMNI